MLNIIEELYGLYGKHINEHRALPSIRDGAKLVERRLLVSVYDMARDKLTKSARVVGHAIGSYHPHGDVAAYGSLVGLVHNGFVRKQGNFGDFIGTDPSPPAAMRYTECGTDKTMLKLAFEHIKAVKHEALEQMDEEPIHLPIMLPLCLMGKYYTTGIGFGFKTTIPSYEIADLIKRLEWKLGYRKTEPVIAPISDCILTSTTKELKQLLNVGKEKIGFKGQYETDEKSKSVIIHSVPHGTTMRGILKKFSKEIEVNKSVGWSDESSKMESKLRLTALKPRSFGFDKMVAKVDKILTSSVSFECNVVGMNGTVQLISIDDLLLNVYKEYEQIVKEVLEQNIKQMQYQIDECDLIDRLKPVLSKELKSHPNDVDKVIENISKSLKVDNEVIKTLFDKYTISRIFKVKTDSKAIKDKKKIVEKNLKGLQKYVWDEKYKSI